MLEPPASDSLTNGEGLPHPLKDEAQQLITNTQNLQQSIMDSSLFSTVESILENHEQTFNDANKLVGRMGEVAASFENVRKLRPNPRKGVCFQPYRRIPAAASLATARRQSTGP